jgi:hypothetical protein
MCQKSAISPSFAKGVADERPPKAASIDLGETGP